MRLTATAMAAVGMCVALLAPSVPLAAEDEISLVAAFTAAPSPAVAGDRVKFDASSSTAPPDAPIERYDWDLDGDGRFETNTWRRTHVAKTFVEPGDVLVRLRVTDADGARAEAELTLEVRPAPPTSSPTPTADRGDPQPRTSSPPGAHPGETRAEPSPGAPADREHAPVHRPDPSSDGSATDEGSGPTPKPPTRMPRLTSRDIRAMPALRPVARMAATTTVDMGDNFFSPRIVTIDKGDTVTWINRGKLPHTATGDSFDTDLLQPGQRRSHTFREADKTYSYECDLHPEMTGEVRVVASGSGDSGGDDSDGGDSSGGAGSGGGGSGSDGTSGSGTTASTSSSSSGTGGSSSPLPLTGTDLLLLAATGALLAAAGSALRRGLRPSAG